MSYLYSAYSLVLNARINKHSLGLCIRFELPHGNQLNASQVYQVYCISLKQQWKMININQYINPFKCNYTSIITNYSSFRITNIQIPMQLEPMVVMTDKLVLTYRLVVNYRKLLKTNVSYCSTIYIYIYIYIILFVYTHAMYQWLFITPCIRSKHCKMQVGTQPRCSSRRVNEDDGINPVELTKHWPTA